MRQHDQERLANDTARRLMSVDFHDFLERASRLDDVELAREWGLSVWEVRMLRKRIRRR
ncbi:MAG: hypothetical protein L5657_00165 [Calditerricola sp.]|nr:hypothetical protein [Calditerricola sp.]